VSWIVALALAGQADVELFERKIRPVLVKKCYECHSAAAKKLKGDLRLDTPEGTRKVVTPGDPAASLLLKAIRYADEELRMPPKERLSAEVAADFETWIRRGAADPRTGPAPKTSAQAHWAFLPPRDVAPPTIRNPRSEIRNEIDAFLLAKLAGKKLRPSPPADRRTLLRRLSFDLVGLPPEPEDVDAFVADPSPHATEKVVDRLLGSPHYGERWARHWLDVVRYADAKGWEGDWTEKEIRFAYQYRDWVIRALNEDLPFDRFVIEQLAADHLPLGEDVRPLAALGFITVQKGFAEVFEEEKHERLDECIDMVSRGLMALTVTCARCHDHKHDPITARDYYALHGIFASSKSVEKPLIPESSEVYRAYKSELDRRQKELERFQEARRAEFRSAETIARYLLAAHEARDLTPKGSPWDAVVSRFGVQPAMLTRWKDSLARHRARPGSIFALWQALAELPREEFAHRSAARVSAPDLPALIAQAFAEPPGSLEEAAERYGALLSRFDQPAIFADAEAEALRQVLHGADAPPNVAPDKLDGVLGKEDQGRLKELRTRLDDWREGKRPPTAHVLVDENPHNSRVFLRGDHKKPGDEAARGFPALLSGGAPRAFSKGSGRLELAQAVASPDNPLTARVIVNRVWLHHFGEGIVRTPSDFGTHGEPPTHPELLDWLTRRFVEDGWSLKKLHRRIVLTNAYAQSSGDDPAARQVDPENRLLWRMNRRRLEFEALRDALLSAAGSLDPTVGGPPPGAHDPTGARRISVDHPRRSVYTRIQRMYIDEDLLTFDLANPVAHAPRRVTTTTPQQAFFMMNGPFVGKQARALAARLHGGTEGRIRELYRRVYQREPAPIEVEAGRSYVDGSDGGWERYAHVLLMSAEFAFVD